MPMSPTPVTTGVGGRRKRVTEASMAQAGIDLTLPEVSVKSVADKLGVSIVAIYNNIDGADALKSLVASEIFARWNPPSPHDGQDVETALVELAIDLERFVHDNPGIAHYLATVNASSRDALVKIDTVQLSYARTYGLSIKQASWMVTIVAEHAVALAEHIHFRGRVPDDPVQMRARTDLVTVAISRGDKVRDHHQRFVWAIRATIVGAQKLIRDPDFEDY